MSGSLAVCLSDSAFVSLSYDLAATDRNKCTRELLVWGRGGRKKDMSYYIIYGGENGQLNVYSNNKGHHHRSLPESGVMS